MRDLTRRLAALEQRRGSNVPRYVVLWNEHDEAKIAGDDAHAIRVAWVKPDGQAIFVLPDNGRNPLLGASL